MRMIVLISILSLFWSLLTAPSNKAGVIFIPDEIKPYETIWRATCKVESDFNPFAIGDKHLKQKSYGIVQVRQTRLDDYFMQTGIRYSVTDMYDTVKSKQVFLWYAMQIHPGDMERVAREWNGGDQGMKRKSTLKYWDKIEKWFYRYRNQRKN